MPLQEVRHNDARQLKDIADAISKSHKVIVVTGAGISTSCGIPDFRSKDGLYNMIPEQCLPTPPSSQPTTPSRKRKASHLEGGNTPSRKRLAIESDDEESPSSQHSTSSQTSRRSSGSPVSRMTGQDLFHARVFQRADTTQIFNQFIAGFKQKLRDDVTQTSKTHKFIRILRDGGRLMRCYTQNIDGLEEREGLCVDLSRGKGNKRRFMKKHYESPRPEYIRDTDFDGGCEVVQLHGELSRLRCTVCSTEEEWTEEASEILLEGAAPKCNTCNEKSELRQATGKRGLTVGTLRPNIVLYGEEHPQNTLLSPLVPYDILSGPEILIIMGTSLKVFGMQKIIRDFAKAVHGKKNGRVIFINRTKPAESVWEGVIDDFVEMDCDDWVEDLKSRRPGLWLRQGELELKETKPASKRKRKSEDTEVEGQSSSSSSLKKVRVKHNPHITVDIPKNKATTKTTLKEKQQQQQQTTSSIPKTPLKSIATRATKWKNTSPSKDLRHLLSPLVRAKRPESSPLSSPSSKELTSSPTQPPYSPLTPACTPYTPFTPTSNSISQFAVRHQSKTPSKLRIHQDVDADPLPSLDDTTRLHLDVDATNTNADDDKEGEEEDGTMIKTPQQNFSTKLFLAQVDGTLDHDDVSQIVLSSANKKVNFQGNVGNHAATAAATTASSSGSENPTIKRTLMTARKPWVDRLLDTIRSRTVE